MLIKIQNFDNRSNCFIKKDPLIFNAATIVKA